MGPTGFRPNFNWLRLTFAALAIAVVVVFTVILWDMPRLVRLGLERELMQDHPARIFRRYEPDLREYARHLEAGDVYSEVGRGYAIPQFLVDLGARYVFKEGDCFVIRFGFMPSDAVPELWYRAKGLAPLPAGLIERKRNPFFKYERLAAEWGECYWDS